MAASDRELLARSASGDDAAFATFVKRHQAAVFRFVSAIAPSQAEAEDTFQDAFLSAWRAAGSFRGEAEARAWLLTIARNAVYRLRRRRSGEPSEFASIDELGQRAGWGVPDPEAEAARLEGFSGKEVAEMTGLTIPAMKSRLHRARLALTAAVKEELGGKS